MEYAALNNGVKMPMAGIGTFLLSPDEAEASVLSALQCGYRLIDTANAYVNEKAVGRAIKKSGVDRKDIFLETKLWPSFYEQADTVDKTLQRLDTDYIDLLLIHQPAGNYVAGYKLMEKACKEGKVRAIGLSNFNPAQIREILEKFALPTRIPCPWATLEEAVGLDKKRSGDSITFILLEELGRAVPRKMGRGELLALLGRHREELEG